MVNFWPTSPFCREVSKTPQEHRASCLQPTVPEDLVFTHHDLAPRNIILETATGRLWVVDCNDAGFYPPSFARAAMHNFKPPPEWSWFARWRWTVFAWIATGFVWRQRGILAEVLRKTLRFPTSRRFNIKARAIPSVKPVDD